MRRLIAIVAAVLMVAASLSADAQILPNIMFAQPPAPPANCGKLSLDFSQSCLITLTLGMP